MRVTLLGGAWLLLFLTYHSISAEAQDSWQLSSREPNYSSPLTEAEEMETLKASIDTLITNEKLSDFISEQKGDSYRVQSSGLAVRSLVQDLIRQTSLGEEVQVKVLFAATHEISESWVHGEVTLKIVKLQNRCYRLSIGSLSKIHETSREGWSLLVSHYAAYRVL